MPWSIISQSHNCIPNAGLRLPLTRYLAIGTSFRAWATLEYPTCSPWNSIATITPTCWTRTRTTSVYRPGMPRRDIDIFIICLHHNCHELDPNAPVHGQKRVSPHFGACKWYQYRVGTEAYWKEALRQREPESCRRVYRKTPPAFVPDFQSRQGSGIDARQQGIHHPLTHTPPLPLTPYVQLLVCMHAGSMSD